MILNVWNGFKLTFVEAKSDESCQLTDARPQPKYGVAKPSEIKRKSPVEKAAPEMLELLAQLVDSSKCSMSDGKCRTHEFPDPCPHGTARNLIGRLTGVWDDSESEIPF
jgi:hypothetical protein